MDFDVNMLMMMLGERDYEILQLRRAIEEYQQRLSTLAEAHAKLVNETQNGQLESSDSQ